MADVDMTDAGIAAPNKAKMVVKSAKSGAPDASTDGKKRFEVKKVGNAHLID